MPKTIQIGGRDVVLPDDSALAADSADDSAAQFRADKPEEPERLESPQYVFRPNDPYQSSIDRVVALGNVGKTKPWVRKAFVIVFLILPFTFMELMALVALFDPEEDLRMRRFLMCQVLALIYCTPGLLIWYGTMRKSRQ